jgi:hypothetical protein
MVTVAPLIPTVTVLLAASPEREVRPFTAGREREMQVQITFEERPIYRAPLDVLSHLYYYTVQYGLSVRQFTGEHWKYWEKLPKRLRQAQGHPEEVEPLIVELEALAAGSEERRRKRQAQIEGKWAEKEIILNAQLLSVLAAMPGELVALGFQNLTGSRDG